MTPAVLRPANRDARLAVEKGLNAAAAAALVLAGLGQAAALSDDALVQGALAWVRAVVSMLAGG